MFYNVDMLKEELEAAMGLRPLDKLLFNLKLVDVYTNEIRPANIGIYNGKIVGLDMPEDRPCVEKLDCNGQYAAPGFMDAHVHIETTLLTPEALAEVIVPWGTTTLFVDAMEIANVAGSEGLKALVKDADKLPFRIFLEIPSRVPTAPGLETAGARIDAEEVKNLMELSETVSLGELDPSKILSRGEEYLHKIVTTLNKGKICNGHAIGLGPDELNVYAAGHLADDHESVTYEELLDRLRLGIKALVREGSSERNVEELMSGVVKHGLSTENILFCTDDKHVNDIYKEGHISYNIQKSIDLGLPPLEAIKIATINAAKHFRLEHMIGSLTPGRQADIVLMPDLKNIRPDMVFKNGEVVAEKGRVKSTGTKKYPDELFHTVKVSESLTPESFVVRADGKRAKCRVISLIRDQIINDEIEEWMPVVDGELHADVEKDILKLAVVERHGKNGRVSTAFVKGFSLKSGALASSVSHDHHNIVVVGCNEEDMYRAVQELVRLQGGFAAADKGRVVDSIALPLAGLMSTLTASEVMENMIRINEAAAGLGCNLNAPFMSLSFISLPTVPALGLTDYGLINVKEHKVVDLIIETEK